MTENQQNEKAFIFLYPEVDIIRHEINGGKRFTNNNQRDKYLSRLKKARSESKRKEIQNQAITQMQNDFGSLYEKTLNSCIDTRYRQKGFSIFYALLDESPISPVIESKPNDKIIYVGMDAKTHRTKDKDGNYPYPNQDYILNQLGSPKILRVAGFHMWDCVEKLAKRAYERGMDTLVDEDLTEFFGSRITDSDFRIDISPNFNPRKAMDGMLFDCFMNARKNNPWLWQKY